MTQHIPPAPKKFPAAKQRRMDELLVKNAEGTITVSEKSRLENLVAEAERLMVANGKRLAEFAQGQRQPSRRRRSRDDLGQARTCRASSA